MRDVLIFPFATADEQPLATLGYLVVVGALILVALFNKGVFNQRVEVRVESTVVDVVNVFFEFAPNRLAGGLIRARDDIEEVALEPGQFE